MLECETEVVSGLTAYGPGYIGEGTKELEKVVGLQTDKPLKRAFMPYGGIKMAQQAAENYGFHVNDKFDKIFNEYHKTHNQGVFDAYTPEMRAARHSHVITGLPDTYGRGRIVGDYRRVALYGIDRLIAGKKEDLANCGDRTMTDAVIRQREEITEQIRALQGMKKMAEIYGYDISKPGHQRRRGRPVALLWLPGRHQDPERRRHVRGPRLHLPGHLHPARPRGRQDHRGRGPGAHRPPRASSCAWSSSLVSRPTRPSSPATPCGPRLRWLVWARTAAASSPRTTSASCTPSRTWVRPPSPT